MVFPDLATLYACHQLFGNCSPGFIISLSIGGMIGDLVVRGLSNRYYARERDKIYNEFMAKIADKRKNGENSEEGRGINLQKLMAECWTAGGMFEKRRQRYWM